jgi:hypothetical protein
MSETEQAIQAALLRAFPGWRLVDSELQLGPRQVVEWVGRDEAGLLLLVTLGGESAHESALSALELALRAREQEFALLKRYSARELRLVLLLDPEQLAVAQLLAPLIHQPLICMECREWKSGIGTRLELRLLEPECSALGVTREIALSVLTPDQRERAERVAHVLEAAALGARLIPSARTWEFVAEGRSLCSLQMQAHRCEGRVRSGAQALSLDSSESERKFLDLALAEFLRMPNSEPANSLDFTPESGFDPRAPVLTQAELEAFRDPPAG